MIFPITLIAIFSFMMLIGYCMNIKNSCNLFKSFYMAGIVGSAFLLTVLILSIFINEMLL